MLTDGADFDTPTAFTAAEATFTTNVKSYKTLVLPFDADVPEGFTAGVAASAYGSTINMEDVTAINANEPVLVQGEGTVQFTAANVAVAATDDAALQNGLLCGTYKAVAAPLGSYVLQKQNDQTGFYHVEGEIPVGAFRAWLCAPASSVKAFYLGQGGATGISLTQAPSDEVIHNVAGQRLQKMQRGVNIVGGKKIVKP